MQFEWDPEKDRENQEKHGVAFMEATEVFDDPLQWTISDPDHSISEHRYLTTARSKRRILIVSHTEDEDDRIRIISARTVTPAERKTYEEGE
jgi:uncharacterized protein